MSVTTALALAGQGWHVFPVRMPDKRPLVKWGEEATTDAETIAGWWSIDYPDAAVGVHTGRSGLVVVDIDERDGKSGSANLAAAGIELPATLRYRTPSGGEHHLYAAPQGRALTVAQGVPVKAVDIRAGNGFAIFHGRAPKKAPTLAPAPEWALIEQRGRTGATVASSASVEAFAARLTPGKPSKPVRKAVKKVTPSGMSHADMLEAVSELVRLGVSGERGVAAALDQARSTYAADWPDAERHWDNAVAGSVRRLGLPPVTLELSKAERDAIKARRHARPAASDGADVLDEVRRQLARFVVLPSEHHEVAVALWVAHVHLIDGFETTPRLWFHSPEPGSGKTRALEVAAQLTPQPIEAFNATVAYIARKLDATGGRSGLYLDEVDATFSPKATSASQEELRGILNAGYRRGATYGRAAVRGKEVVTEDVACFAPVALAGLGDLPDTIRTRAVAVPMRRRTRQEACEPYRQRVNGPELHATRDRLAAWAKRAVKRLTYPELPESIADRDADVWEPLIAVADAAGGVWPELARAAAVAIVTNSKARPATLGVRLLGDVRRVLGDRARIRSVDLLGELIAIEDAPWADLGGKGPIDSRFLGRHFAEYDIPAAHSIRFDPTASGGHKGWNRGDFADAWSRYLPESPTPPVTLPIEN